MNMKLFIIKITIYLCPQYVVFCQTLINHTKILHFEINIKGTCSVGSRKHILSMKPF